MTDRVILTYENTHINDSYLVRSKKDMCEFLNAIRKECSPDMAVSARSIRSLVCEWRSHNLFYFLHATQPVILFMFSYYFIGGDAATLKKRQKLVMFPYLIIIALMIVQLPTSFVFSVRAS